MRRAPIRQSLALAALITASSLGAAHAEHWVKFADGANGIEWSYDSDYSYKDRQTGRIVAMQAISKPSAKLGPAGPGKSDGVGSVVAVDCLKKNLIMVGSYKPSAPLDIKATWRNDAAKKAEGAENEALISAVCAMADKTPMK